MNNEELVKHFKNIITGSTSEQDNQKFVQMITQIAKDGYNEKESDPVYEALETLDDFLEELDEFYGLAALKYGDEAYQAMETLHFWYNKQRNDELLKKRWAVVGFDYDMAKQLITAIEWSANKDISRRVQSKNELRTEFTDGTILRWVKASDNARGQKFGKMWCDKNINEDILKCVILPMYFGKREDINWI